MNVAKAVLRFVITTILAASVLVIQDAPMAAASRAAKWSWSLSHDMRIDVSGGSLNNNPLNDVWTFHDVNGPLSDPSPSGTCYGGTAPVTCWEDLGLGFRVSGSVGIPTSTVASPGCPQAPLTHGVPGLHPAQDGDVWVRWTNPIDQQIRIQVLGRFTAIDPCSGGLADGVNWVVFDERGHPLAASNAPLSSTPALPKDTDVFYFSHTVDPGGYIDFAVGPNGNYYYDSTEFDVLIVGQ